MNSSWSSACATPQEARTFAFWVGSISNIAVSKSPLCGNPRVIEDQWRDVLDDKKAYSHESAVNGALKRDSNCSDFVETASTTGSSTEEDEKEKVRPQQTEHVEGAEKE